MTGLYLYNKTATFRDEITVWHVNRRELQALTVS